MIKFEKESDSPLSRKGGKIIRKAKGLSRRIIILFITIIISLSTLLIPCTVGSFTQTNSCIVNACALEDKQQEAQSYIDNIINDYLKKLEGKGYKNVSFETNPILKDLKKLSVYSVRPTTDFSEEGIKQRILSDFIFYAEYTTLSKNNNEITYYFKTVEESDNFIIEINKYEKTEYNKTENVKSVIGKETSQDVLQNEIQNKKAEAERRAAEEAERQRKIEEQKRRQQKEAAMKQVVKEQQTVSSSNSEIVNYALQFNGNPYVYGGTSLTNGADCSGFVQSIYKHFGVSLPRTARAQAGAGHAVSFSNLQPGDLVFYSGDGGASITHVALYIGNGKIIHAMNPKDGIGITSVNIMVKMTARRVI